MSVVVYELNEIPKRVFDFYTAAFPNSSFSKLRNFGSLFETTTADVGALSPWITWPTLHRGVSNLDHEISDLGQDLTQINQVYPSLDKILASSGVSVGVFGSLQTYPLPDQLDNFKFYVPDTFAAGSECFPKKLSEFQEFNLNMVRSNARNVQSGIAVYDAGKFLKTSRDLGLTPLTLGKLSKQILSEKFNQDRLVRRRSSQAEIAFDLFFHQLRLNNPNISFFFTNHLASSLHRYWPTIFPSDYEEGKFDKSWLERWSGEIPHAIRIVEHQLSKLIMYCDQRGSELIVCSSMGQGAVENTEVINRQVFITNIRRLLNYIGVHENEWEPRMAMAPLVVVKPLSAEFHNKLHRLNRIKVNGSALDFFITSTGDVRFSIGLINQEELKVLDGNDFIDPELIGIDNVWLQDAAGSYAYHIPQGILMHYNSKRKVLNDRLHDWKSISVLDFAPSLLNKFGVKIPDYMKGDRTLFLS